MLQASRQITVLTFSDMSNSNVPVAAAAIATTFVVLTLIIHLIASRFGR